MRTRYRLYRLCGFSEFETLWILIKSPRVRIGTIFGVLAWAAACLTQL